MLEKGSDERQKSRMNKDRAWIVYDFYEVLESVAWLWRGLGIFPIVVTDRSARKSYKLSKFYATWSILTFAVTIGHTTFKMAAHGQFLRMIAPITGSMIIIRLISSLMCMSFSTIWRMIAFNELSESINDLSRQNSILEKANCPFDYDSSERMIRSYVWTTFLVVMFIMAYDLFVLYLSMGITALEWTLWMVPTVIQTMDLTILGSLIGWIGLKFRSINEKLSDVAVRANASSPMVQFFLQFAREWVVVTSDVCAESLRVLSKAHYETCAIGGRINRAFNFSVVVHVTTAFIVLSTSPYFIFYELQRDGTIDFTTIIVNFNVELNYSVPIIVLVIICNWTSGQATDAGTLIHEIRVKKADSLLYDAVKTFSLQLHHQKLDFTGAGFFPLNSRLLQTMAGTIITYLVVLIQFKPKLD